MTVAPKGWGLGVRMRFFVVVHDGEDGCGSLWRANARPVSFVPGNTNDVQTLADQAGLQGPFRVVIGIDGHAPGVGQSHVECANPDPRSGGSRGGGEGDNN